MIHIKKNNKIRRKLSKRAVEIAMICRNGMDSSHCSNAEYGFLESIERQIINEGWVTEKQIQAVEKVINQIKQCKDVAYKKDVDRIYGYGCFRWDGEN